MTKAKVLMIALGGTISMTKPVDANDAAASKGVVPSLTVNDFINNNPELSQHADLTGLQFKQVASSSIVLKDLYRLASVINNADVDGVVLVQGTDAMEDTAFVLQCLCPANKSIVITGAMRNPSQVSSDSGVNLHNAVQIAASKKTRELGVLLATGYAFYSAIHVQKLNAVNVEAFGSDKGLVGWVTESRVHVINKPVLPTLLNPKAVDALLQPYLQNDTAASHASNGVNDYDSSSYSVPIYTAVIDDNALVLKAIIASRPSGIVIAGMGGGHIAGVWVDLLAEAAKKMPIILSSRCAFGEVLTETYGYPGSEMELIAAGLIPSAWLNTLKVRLLLMLMLDSQIYSHQDIREAFTSFYAV